MTEYVDTEERIELKLDQVPSNVISQKVFGLSPYIIIRPNNSEEVGVIEVSIEAGGGALIEDLADVFESLQVVMREPETVREIKAAVAAAETDDDEGPEAA